MMKYERERAHEYTQEIRIRDKKNQISRDEDDNRKRSIWEKVQKALRLSSLSERDDTLDDTLRYEVEILQLRLRVQRSFRARYLQYYVSNAIDSCDSFDSIEL